jgi:hypothetical protein
MDAVSDAPGWTIAEAIERTSDPDHLIVSPSENASNANQQSPRVDHWLPTPSAMISAVSAVLADRIQGLRNVLASGSICAFGTSQTGIEGPIGRLQWRRSGISIDVGNGDLCDGQDHRAVPMWTGLSLRLPDAALPANQPQNGAPSKIAEIPSKARAQTQTKEKSRVECVAWLEGMMSNPEIVPRSIDDLWAEAQLKWPNKLRGTSKNSGLPEFVRV